jgi:hypothetical protein
MGWFFVGFFGLGFCYRHGLLDSAGFGLFFGFDILVQIINHGRTIVNIVLDVRVGAKNIRHTLLCGGQIFC